MDVDPSPSTSTAHAPVEKPEHTPEGDAALQALGVDSELPYELVFPLLLSWSGQKFELTVTASDTVGDLKGVLWSLTSVPPQRQKIVGLVKGKLPDDAVEVASLGLKEGIVKAFMMIGTPEGMEMKEVGSATGETPQADVDYSASAKAAQRAAQNVRNRRKLKEASEALKLDIMTPPRPGKRLLVLDLDYCILDTSLWKEFNFNAAFFARPFLHQFLKAISPHYDIVIWSQTSWRWLETKLVELNILGEEKAGDYHIPFVLDRTPMFSVYSERDGKSFKHEVKALPLIWSKFPEQWSAKNTIGVDDLSRNFAMNPQNGLKVHAYKDAMVNQATDRELCHVARYLLQLTLQDDFSKLDHRRFRHFEGPLPPDTEDPLTWKRPEDGPSN
ncbi:ubiquitin-like domain-containing CTD phosphatase 1 [Pseudohyphozyma bogoriensis]|nr:ubiquitin-like domain-containing CTD phosphatase 1 [Pseudohyphozyma bogoriensis]